MARKLDRLKDRSVKAKRARGYYGDGDGLYLQVTATGAKSWIFRFKRDGKARDMGLGGYPTVSLADARQRAHEACRLRDAGEVPIAARDAAVAQKQLAEARGTTFRQCAEQVIASQEAGWRNARHRQQWRNTLATELVMRVLQPIWTTKTETASRLRGRIESVLGAAETLGYRTGKSPAQWRGHLKNLLPRPSKIHKPEHHPALPYKDVPAFMARLRAREGVTARALELTILAATRTKETIGATFDEFDLAAGVWTIPADRMKSELEHRVPLCDRAVAIVKELAATRLNDYVFPGLVRGEPLSSDAMLGLLGVLRSGITVHGFRSSFRDWAGEETNAAHDICEAALAHMRKDKAHAAYQRGDLLAKRRQLMDGWATYCEPPIAKRRRAA